MITELRSPIPMLTPKGPGMCLLVIDYGPEHDLIWVVALRDPPHAGEIWAYPNALVRVTENVTLGRSFVNTKPQEDTHERRT